MATKNRYFTYGNDDGNVILVNLETGNICASFYEGEPGYNATQVLLSHDAKQIIIGYNSEVRIFNISTGLVNVTLKPDYPHTITKMELTMDDMILIVAYSNSLVIAWNTQNGSIKGKYKSYGGFPNTLTTFTK